MYEDIHKQIGILQKEQASLAAKESKRAAKKAAVLAAYKQSTQARVPLMKMKKIQPRTLKPFLLLTRFVLI
jgi:hypothetical protein